MEKVVTFLHRFTEDETQLSRSLCLPRSLPKYVFCTRLCDTVLRKTELSPWHEAFRQMQKTIFAPKPA
ncbi:MAG: hypothetical protein IJ480_03370 [Clostridia bacterium]|nr:hypothetical protein [Clostridia bacterium]